jgi:hypothetical protein
MVIRSNHTKVGIFLSFVTKNMLQFTKTMAVAAAVATAITTATTTTITATATAATTLASVVNFGKRLFLGTYFTLGFLDITSKSHTSEVLATAE